MTARPEPGHPIATEPDDPDPWGPTAPPRPTDAIVAGIDGCRGAWLIVRSGPGPGLRAELVDDLSPIMAAAATGDLAAVAVDMPIGLLAAEPRPADRAARRLLGPRRSSVFPAPVRAVLGSPDYDEARARSLAASGRSLPIQTFNLLPAIGHLDAALQPVIDADRRHVVVEAHPELALARLQAGVPLEPKRTSVGRRQRLDLLNDTLGPALAEMLDAGLPTEDLLDAAALVVTARRLAEGTARSLGGDLVDTRGRPVQVVY